MILRPRSRETPPTVDLHTHVLPGIDDGPRSLEGTIDMLERAWRAGTRDIVATPHMFLQSFGNHDAEAVRRAFDETTRALRERARSPRHGFLREITLYLGAENYVSPEFLEALDAGRVLAINGGRYVLVEFFVGAPRETLELGLRRVLEHGLRPVLAHVERYRDLRDDLATVRRLAEAGTVLQTNSSTVLLPRRSKERRRTFALLEKGLLHVVSSDAHDAARRTFDLDQAARTLKKHFSEAQARAWTCDNALQIIRGEPLEARGSVT